MEKIVDYLTNWAENKLPKWLYQTFGLIVTSMVFLVIATILAFVVWVIAKELAGCSDVKWNW